MHIATKPVLVLALILSLLAGTSSLYAQGNETVAYLNAWFSVEVPMFAQVQVEDDDSVTFVAGQTVIDVRLVPTVEEVSEVIGTQAANMLVAATQPAPAGAAVAFPTCPPDVPVPCVERSGASATRAFQWNVVYDAANDVFFALTFQAPTRAEIAAVDPDAVVESFQVAAAAADTIPPNDANAPGGVDLSRPESDPIAGLSYYLNGKLSGS